MSEEPGDREDEDADAEHRQAGEARGFRVAADRVDRPPEGGLLGDEPEHQEGHDEQDRREQDDPDPPCPDEVERRFCSPIG